MQLQFRQTGYRFLSAFLLALASLLCTGIPALDAAVHSTHATARLLRAQDHGIQVRFKEQSGADLIEHEYHTATLETVDFKGVVLVFPANPQGLGEWHINSRGTRWTVIANLSTQISLPLPRRGQWVEVEGARQSDGSVLATKIRADDYNEDEVVVRLAEGVQVNSIANEYNLKHRSTLLGSANIHLLEMKTGAGHKNVGEDEEALVNRLKADSDVIWAELNYVGSIPVADPYDIWKWGGPDPRAYVNQTAFAQIGLPPVQPFYRGEGISVAILDTGVSSDHPQLAGHLVMGRDLVDDDDDANEQGDGMGWGHGTHVAGIVAHIAPDSTIIPVRVLDSYGRGDSFVVAYAIEWAVAQGASVINLSLGTPHDSQVLREAVQNAVEQGVIIVAAAGNEDGESPQYPAAYAGVVAVTAVDDENHKADFANYSEWVDIAAPGVGITSTVTGPKGHGYASWSGTSMASSFVSGVAVLGLSKNRGLSGEAVRHLLIEKATNIDEFNPAYKEGLGGLVNARDVLGIRTLYVPSITR